MNYHLEQTSSRSWARRGYLETPHGRLETPFFMPIATKGAVKTLSSFDIERLGSPILLSNTYHLYLRPGLEVIRAMGGLHKLMSWSGSILTDSGGYQVFSLAKTRKITEEGAIFASHIDGSRHVLTPELSMEVQQALGSDIVMVLDECTPSGSSNAYLKDSLARTLRWAERSKLAFETNRSTSNNTGSQLFGIVQGGTDTNMRQQHAQALISIGFDGYAIGGLSVGEPFADACRTVSALDEVLPANRPRYFMGGAKPHEIVEYVKRGIDMLDCVLPTRNARHGVMYRFVHTDFSRPDFYEVVHITNEKYRTDETALAIEEETDKSTKELSRYSLGYVHHLFRVQEVLGQRLLTMVNVRFYLQLMKLLREGIQNGTM